MWAKKNYTKTTMVGAAMAMSQRWQTCRFAKEMRTLPLLIQQQHCALGTHTWTSISGDSPIVTLHDAQIPCRPTELFTSRYKTCFDTVLHDIRQSDRYRDFKTMTRLCGQFPKALHNASAYPVTANPPSSISSFIPKEVSVWCSNDYLGMGQHPAVLQAAHTALSEAGTGSGGTRNISGTNIFHVRLEKELASLHDMQAALLFGSCYTANQSSLIALAKMIPGLVMLSDEKNHASLIQGVRSSKAPILIFRHNDVEHLEELLKQLDLQIPKLIVFESIYSMDGTIAPIADICRMATYYNALTFVDEVHAVGLYGNTGAGIIERNGMVGKVDIITGTLAKAYGNYGGYIAGPLVLIDAIRSTASGFIFTSSLPPAICNGALAAIQLLRRDPSFRQAHCARVALLKNTLRKANLPMLETPSHIVPLMVGNARLCKKMADSLLKHHHIYVQPINYPTVPLGQERFRLTPSPDHTPQMIEHLCRSLLATWERYSSELEATRKELTAATKAKTVVLKSSV